MWLLRVVNELNLGKKGLSRSSNKDFAWNRNNFGAFESPIASTFFATTNSMGFSFKWTEDVEWISRTRLTVRTMTTSTSTMMLMTTKVFNEVSNYLTWTLVSEKCWIFANIMLNIGFALHLFIDHSN